MPPVNSAGLTRARIRSTAELIRPFIRRTPVIELAGDELGLDPDVRITLKLELLQHAGSFKARGAFTNLLTRPVPAAGVVAASGGNHGAAVAYAAMRCKVPARIFVPSVASPAKMRQIRDYGAELVVAGDRYADALAASESYLATSGALGIHAFEQVETLLGQGTLAAEFEEQAPGVDTILIAVGGGGLIGGVAAWHAGASGAAPAIVGVEPAAAPTLTKALEAGAPVDAEAGGIAADSLAPRRVGSIMFPLAQAMVKRTILVSDDEIREAQRELWRLLRVVAEPGGAAAFAALRSGRYAPAANEHVGVVVCGGNTTAVNFGD
ncbi:MAG: threonine/serine dehydratase [Gemmatimonadales bacterium]